MVANSALIEGPRLPVCKFKWFTSDVAVIKHVCFLYLTRTPALFLFTKVQNVAEKTQDSSSTDSVVLIG